MYSMYNSRENLQLYSTSHENSSMLGSNNIGDHVLSLKFEPNQQKICNLQQFSGNSHENSSMLGSNKIGDHV